MTKRTRKASDPSPTRKSSSRKSIARREETPTPRPVKGGRLLKAELLDAAKSGDLGRVQVAVYDGSGPSARNDQGDSALSLAAGGGHLKVVQFLVENRAKVTAAGRDGRTPVHHAVDGGHLPVVRYLLERGAADAAPALDDLLRYARSSPGATPAMLDLLESRQRRGRRPSAK